MARIVSISPEPGRLYRLDGSEFLLGRRLDCHIHVNDQRASRRHARIRREADAWQVEDLGSCNGTHLNGRRIQGVARIRHGDEIEIGSSRYRVDLSEDSVQAAENAAVRIESTLDRSNDSMIEVALLRQGLAPPPSYPDPVRERDRFARKLQAMYRISELVATTLEPRALLGKVTALLLDVFPHASAAVAVTLDPRTQQLRTQAARRRDAREVDLSSPNVNIPQSVVDRVFRQGHSVLLRDASDPTQSQPVGGDVINRVRQVVDGGTIPKADEGPVGWRMGAPLSCRGENLGILLVEAEPSLGYFTQDALDLLDSLASQAGVALHLIGVHQRLLARERLDYDLRVARQIQRNLLPREPPGVSGLDFAVHYEPAFQVGGDFYDFLSLEGQRLAVVAGDVSGKAISGALFMARVTSEIRAAAPIEHSPRRVLQRVNRALNEVADDGIFTTMVYCVIDLDKNVLRYANAGHTVPLLRRDGRVIQLDHPEARTIPLGIETRLEVGEAQFELQAGDTLMLYTDGIIEARSMNGAFYGIERLIQVMERCSGPARTTLEAVLLDVDRFVEEASQSDDQTVVCISVGDTSPKRFNSQHPSVAPPA